MSIHKLDCQCPFCKAKRGESSGKDNSFYGKKHTQEAKDKNRQSHLREKNYLWKGDKYQHKERWIIWIDGIKYFQARYIAMKCLGRKLIKGEEVHHINGNPSDDRAENLYLFATKGEHTKYHKMKNPPILISNLNSNNFQISTSAMNDALKIQT